MPLIDALPSHTVPVHYDIVLTPDAVTFKFEGQVTIDVKSVEKADSIVLNCKEIEVKSATIDGVAVEGFSLDDKMEFLVLPAPAGVTLAGDGAEHKVHIDFVGCHNDQMCGFYRSTYKDVEGEDKVMLVTQFESVDARRCFPCFDEPIRKATFDSTLIVDNGLTALSNMPVKEETAEGDSKKRVRFERTPVMSTYLVAYVVGELECGEGVTKGGIPVRVYAQRGKSIEGAFALEVARRGLDYLGEYFDFPYPLPKLDMVSVPDFSAGAMENFGLITYREVLLLVHEKTPAFLKQRCSYVVMHELSHQWFGNTVTFKEWPEIWENEAFATAFGFEGADHVHPEWRLWDQFIINEFSRGLELDALASSHAVLVDIERSRDIDDVFDAISYSKGASLIKMLLATVGEDALRRGMQIYINRHQFANAETSDIWAAVSEAAGGIDVAAMMDCWVTQTGFPLLTVAPAADGAGYTVRQERFFSDANASDEDRAATRWTIPLRCAAYGAEPGSEPAVSTQFFRAEDGAGAIAVEVPDLPAAAGARAFVKINHTETGFFRVHYAPEMLAAMDIPRLPVKDRAMLVSTMHALAKAGRVSVADALGLLTRFSDERDFVVWTTISGLLGDVSSVFCDAGDAVSDGLDALKRRIYAPVTAALGWVPAEGESHLDTMLRSMVIPAAARAGETAVLEEARRRFASGDIPHDVLSGVLAALVSDDHAAHLPRVIEMYAEAESQDVRLACLGAMGAPRDAETVTKMLQRATFDESSGIRAQDAFYVYGAAASHPVGRKACWAFVTDNWDALQTKFSGGMGLLGRCASAPVAKMTTADDATAAETFFNENPGEGIGRTIAQAVETARSRSAWAEKDGEGLVNFIAAQGSSQ